MNIVGLIFLLGIVWTSAVFHEYAHGFVANKLGDPTARIAGRLTLNPLVHVDPLGTVVFPLLLLIIGSPILLAFAKPVPVNPYLLKDPKKGMLMVALAGPSTNLIIATISALLFHLIGGLPVHPLPEIFRLISTINVALAVFNLIPIPPVDGSRIVSGLLPDEIAEYYNSIEPYGIFILFAAMFMGLLNWFVWPLSRLFLHILGL
jgi:Zn-dependent protease